MAAFNILQEAQREALKNTKKATCLDPLQLMVVDVEGKPEILSKTVDQVAASSVAPSALVMLNAAEMMKTKEDRHWPNYKMFRTGDILAQVQFSLQWQEFQGLPSQYPGLWLVTGRGYSAKAVVGVIMDKPEMSTSSSTISLQEYLAACIEVVRGKLGQEVEIMVYVHKVIEDIVVLSTKSMHATTLPAASVFASSQAMRIKKTEDGAVTVTTAATGCSLCDVGFSRDLSQEDHESSNSHKRNRLNAAFVKKRKSMLESPHPLGLQLSVMNPDKDESIKVLSSGLVEITLKPQEEKTFKLQLKNSAPNTEEEMSEAAGLVVESYGVLRGEEVVELLDDYFTQDKKIRLKPARKYKVDARFRGAGIGQMTVPFIATFYHETRSERVGDRVKNSTMVLEVLFKVEDDEVRALLPRSVYQPPTTFSKKWLGKETIFGRQLPKLDDKGAGVGDSLEVKLPLGTHKPSGARRRIIDGRLENCGSSAPDVAEFKKCEELLKADLSMNNYGDRWEFLLHCERHQEDKDIRHYDMSGVQLKIDRTSGLMALEVPGLLEGRPSLIKGDKLFISNDQVKEYEGFVHSLGKTRIFLGFDQSIVPLVRAETFWYVRFHASPYSWDNMHRAVKLCVGSNLNTLLFPKAADLPLSAREQVELQYYDVQVSNNPEQRTAVSAIVTGRSGRVPFLVFGPPGTGKTVTLVEAIKQVWKLDGETHILACAPSNTAADLLATRLGRDIPADQIIRLNALSRPEEAIPDVVRSFSNIGAAGIYIPTMAQLAGYRIIVSTLVTAGKLASAVFPQGHFRHVFIDEAGQATEPETCIALAGIIDADVGQLIMAGDPKQLGPLVRSSLADQYGLSVSLMERLLDGAPYTDPETGNLAARCVIKLVRNFRSHDSLIALPGKLFYRDELVPSAERALVDNCLTFSGLTDVARGKIPLLFHGIIGQDTRDYMSPSFFNPEEVVTVLKYIKQLLQDPELNVKEEEIGVISPYRRQCQKIRSKLGDSSDVMVGTTEEFQGQERRIIILTTVRSNPDFIQLDKLANIGFLKNKKRFNVAITRAQALLIIIGNPNILYKDTEWRELLDYAQRKGCYKGCPFPRLEDGLGRTEARFASQLEQEERSEDMVEQEEVQEQEEQGQEENVVDEILTGPEAGVPSQLVEEERSEDKMEEILTGAEAGVSSQLTENKPEQIERKVEEEVEKPEQIDSKIEEEEEEPEQAEGTEEENVSRLVMDGLLTEVMEKVNRVEEEPEARAGNKEEMADIRVEEGEE